MKSELAREVYLSPNYTPGRSGKSIDTITIHCAVADCSAKRLGEVFSKPSRKASCNYAIGNDGGIACIVEEENRSWCSSSAANDNRAITIEVASENEDPFKVTEKAYSALIDLLTDICRRHIPGGLVWAENKDDRKKRKGGANMTLHRDFANKACPGAYLISKHPDIAAEVNRRLTGEAGKTTGFKAGDRVRVKNAVTYTGRKFVAYYKEYDVIEVKGDRAVIGIGKTVTAAIHTDSIEKR